MMKNFKYILITLFLASLSLGGCSGSKNVTKESDPFENLNRHVFGFNKYVDQKISKPFK